jgi:hypothetical protein
MESLDLPGTATRSVDRIRSHQRQLALHGSIVLLIGLLAGIGFSYAAATEPVTSDLYKNWKFAHLEGMFNGVVVLAAAGVWTFIETRRRVAVDIGRWTLMVGAYANAIGPWITALFIGHRVIEPHTAIESVVVYGFYIPGVLPLVSFLLFVGAQVADRVAARTTP